VIRPSSRAPWRAAVMGSVALLTGTLSPGVASAADRVYRTVDLIYTCEYPLVGEGPMTIRIKGVGPYAVSEGDSTTMRDVEADLTVPEAVAEQLREVGGVNGIRGSVDTGLRITAGIPATATIGDLFVPQQMHEDRGDFPVRAFQKETTTLPTVTAGPAPGPLTIALDNPLTMRLDLHFQNSSPQWQRQDAFRCTPDPGQDTTWSAIPIT